MKQIMLRAMYFMLGGMVGMVLATETLGNRLNAVIATIPPLAGAAAWQGCDIGKRAPKIDCQELGRVVMQQELRK